MWHRRRRSEGVGDCGDLVSEAEAFVCGTYAEHQESLGRTVPSWAWVNCLAHGTEAELSELARDGGTWVETDNGSTAWHRMVSFLAADVLTLARARDQSVSTMQHEVLIPLELDLATHTHSQRLGPAEVVNAALAALHGHPTTSP
jgi:hypothetical protein